MLNPLMSDAISHARQIITEQKVKIDGTVREYACELVHRDAGVMVVGFALPSGGSAFGTPITIPAGSISYGWFWRRRPYVVYRMKSPEGAVLAHRFDAANAVEFGDAFVRYRDLVLDWWVLADDTLIEEDREEFDALLAANALGQGDIDGATAAAREVTSRYRHIIDGIAATEAKLAAFASG